MSHNEHFSSRVLQLCALVIFVNIIVGTASKAIGQAVSHVPERQKIPIILTGIVLVVDHRCANTKREDILCRDSDWALNSGRTTYLLYGDTPTLKKFERKRANVTGLFEEQPLVVYGTHLIQRKILVHQIEYSELTEREIEQLVQELKIVPWRGPENHCSPMCWDFAFTDPMVKILQAGRGAQDVLLRHIGDEDIQEQIVMLLGGVADENAIPAIIATMMDGEKATIGSKASRLNLIGNLALTNLTVGEVIWHHGGGIPLDRCPEAPKSCWSKWWSEHNNAFRVGIGGDRLYSNYPNYGIYAQFGDGSVQ
jgi:hypothetical protein